MSLWQQFRRAFRAMPDALLIVTSRSLMRVHSPTRTGVDEPAAICTTCREMPGWPCRPYMDAAEKIYDLTGRR